MSENSIRESRQEKRQKGESGANENSIREMRQNKPEILQKLWKNRRKTVII
ncbi:MAG: hypothetical protein HFH94_06395 [Lachnospiraceae bacterium]|nr:hypothetical protein [Lachnospiraceae bacterium]